MAGENPVEARLRSFRVLRGIYVFPAEAGNKKPAARNPSISPHFVFACLTGQPPLSSRSSPALSARGKIAGACPAQRKSRIPPTCNCPESLRGRSSITFFCATSARPSPCCPRANPRPHAFNPPTPCPFQLLINRRMKPQKFPPTAPARVLLHFLRLPPERDRPNRQPAPLEMSEAVPAFPPPSLILFYAQRLMRPLLDRSSPLAFPGCSKNPEARPPLWDARKGPARGASRNLCVEWIRIRPGVFGTAPPAAANLSGKRLRPLFAPLPKSNAGSPATTGFFRSWPADQVVRVQ